MESKGTTVVASCIHQALTDSHRYTTLTDATSAFAQDPVVEAQSRAIFGLSTRTSGKNRPSYRFHGPAGLGSVLMEPTQLEQHSELLQIPHQYSSR